MSEMTLSFTLREIGFVMDRFIELGERKAGVIVSGNTLALDEIVCSEDDLSRALTSLEEERANAVDSGLAGDAEEIEGLRSSLRQKADKLKVLNERNQRLLKQGLDMVEFELKLFMPQPSYKGVPAKGPVLFDHRV